ncbi:hypothetical protein SAMN02927923_03395 [Microvirga guangxiensis]|uniref:DUF2946 domain-containing protein n=1 Tax=Microvirga guangxiensis TaxID=549386 RepID=A0A1G5KKR3_9HYPH|nr:hypothetical protein SAMN02927923_03395 [Microvirga guangxiensis]
MTDLRRHLEGHWSGGLLAAAMAYFLFLQSLTGAIAQGASASAVADRSFVTCSSIDSYHETGDPPQGSGDGHHKCCGILSQLSGDKVGTLSDGQLVFLRTDPFHEVLRSDCSITPGGERKKSHAAEARAPPQRSRAPIFFAHRSS